jgi:Transposase DDE domain group 1
VEEGQPVGEKGKQPFQLSFNSSVRVDFQGARVTSDGGLILVRELDERLGLSELRERHLTDSRRGKNTQLPLADLLRQSVYSRLAGYEDVNDAERLSQDPTFRLIGSRNAAEDRGAAIARGIGDPQCGADFGDAGGWEGRRIVCGIDWKHGIFGRCVTARGRTDQLRHPGKHFALQFGLELAFADRSVVVRC